MEHKHPAAPSPNFRVHPPKKVMQEIEERNTNVNHLIEEAKLALLDMQGEESGVIRWFSERGYSDSFVRWLAEEAKAREQGLTGDRVEPAQNAKLM